MLKWQKTFFCCFLLLHRLLRLLRGQRIGRRVGGWVGVAMSTPYALHARGREVRAQQAPPLWRAQRIHARAVVVVHEHAPVCQRLRLDGEEQQAAPPDVPQAAAPSMRQHT